MTGGIRRGKLKLKSHAKVSKSFTSSTVKKNTSSVRGPSKEEESIWKKAYLTSQLKGPLILISNDSILCCSKEDKTPSLISKTEKDIFIPTSTEQVWLSSSIVEGRIIFKSGSTGKLLSSDMEGNITATKEAIGPGDEWIPFQRESQHSFAFQNFTFKSWLNITNNSITATKEDTSLFTIQYQQEQQQQHKELHIQKKSRESYLEERIKKKHDPYC